MSRRLLACKQQYIILRRIGQGHSNFCRSPALRFGFADKAMQCQFNGLAAIMRAEFRIEIVLRRLNIYHNQLPLRCMEKMT
ncbi:MAG: hypothetical protein JWM58_125 [Rhizobium sp.]|nr:hypothetical protein [Rhizobium sp.]